MKKKIAILGSTGSIGCSLLNIIKKDKKNFDIFLLTTNKNYKDLFKQAKTFKVKSLIITDVRAFNKARKNKLSTNFKIYNTFDFNKIFKSIKLDYLMSAITGIAGLDPTLKSIKFTKNIAIANKEAIICGWNLLQRKLKSHKVNFIPVDSEHFSIWFGSDKSIKTKASKIYLTASGGPFLYKKIKDFKKINIASALKHPNWKMGKKISIDSSTMMNKVFEVIEARNIFDFPIENISILTHPQSYLHGIVKFKNGIIKLIAHDTTMEVPIFNTLYGDTNKTFKTKDVDIGILNDLKLKSVDRKQYPLIKILNYLDNNISMFETIIVSANDTLVNLFLNKKINYNEISSRLLNFIKLKEFRKYKRVIPKNVKDITKLDRYVRLKIKAKCI